MEIVISAIMLIVGFVMLVKGADWFVAGASDIAAKFDVPQIVIGLTVVAMGTSLPEAAISISAAVKGSAGIAIGNIVGSNIMNIGLILGITALITPLLMQKATRKYEIPIMIGSTIILAILGLLDNVISRFEGVIFLALFAAYLVYTFKIAAANAEPPEEQKERRNLSTSFVIVITVVGGALIAIGASVTVDGATGIARAFGISEDIIGLTIVAFGTSLPELVTCIAAGLRREADIAIGNIVGSNIFNILFVIGVAATIHPVPYGGEFFRDSIVCIGMPALLWLVASGKARSIKRWGGAVLLGTYAAYFVLFNVGLINHFI